MPSLLLTGPAVEPITLAEAKQFIRVEHDDDDDLITALIAGSRAYVEAQTRRALITQTWRLTRDAWPESGRLAVLPVPLVSLNAARIYKANGATQALDVAAFTVDKIAAPAMLAFTGDALAAPERPVGGIEIDVTCGYGDTAESVPEPLRQAIRQLIAHWYENRTIAVVSGEIAMMPATVSALIGPYRVLAL
jgi:uncharacterized phiE125 gp8 family phage protein